LGEEYRSLSSSLCIFLQSVPHTHTLTHNLLFVTEVK
jgi:hypothetical protein